MTNKTILKGTLAVLLGGMLWSCSEDTAVEGSTGHVVPLVDLDRTVATPRESRATYTLENAPAAADLSLRLTATDGSFSREWTTLSDFDATEAFKVGAYTLEAWYGTAGAQGFECPYFYGSTELQVRDNVSTEVALTASLSQALVLVEYTDAFRQYMTDWSAKVNGINYVQSETRPVFITPGTATVTVDFTKPNGKKGENFKVAEFTASAKKVYKVTVDVNNGEVGGATLVVSWSDDMEDVEVTINIDDYVLDAPEPLVETEGFTSGTAFDVVEGMPLDGKYSFNLIAQAGLGEVMLRTHSLSLIGQGWPEEVDLLKATPEQKATLTSLGLEVLGLWNNPDKLAIVDFTGVPAHLGSMTTDNSSTFTLTLTDTYGRSTEAAVLAMNLEPLTLALSTTGAYAPGSPLVLSLAYNGVDVANRVKIQYRNTLGNWIDATDVTFGEGVARSVSDYVVTINNLPTTMESMSLRAICTLAASTATSETVNVRVQEFEYKADANDVFATRAGVTIAAIGGGDTPALARAAYQISTDGTHFTSGAVDLDGGKGTITGLTPGTTYYLKSSFQDTPVTFTTETAAQIPNGDFEQAWTREDGGSAWDRMSLPGWGTNNHMTTSEGGNFGYVKISGTIETDGASGRGVLIRTVGWGKGNTAVGTVEGAAIMKYGDPGLLHLGATRSARPAGYTDREGPLTTDDLEPLGIEFTSRPSALTFKYKYAPKNPADRGQCEYWLKDAAGNILVQGTRVLEPASAFTDVTIPMTYVAGAAKGAKLYVKFISTNNRDYLTKSNDNFTAPKFMIGGPYMGAQLTIDEVVLNY